MYQNLKEYATGQKPTMKEFEELKREKMLKEITEDTEAQGECLITNGDGPLEHFDEVDLCIRRYR